MILTEEQLKYIVRKAVNNYLSEGRKVLKVGNGGGQQMPPAPMPQEPMQPPMDAGMGADNVPMDGGMDNDPNAMADPGMLDDGQDRSEFDTNFDAGVEADEDEDPKSFIQQLCGKLSQSLSKYNNELGEPDAQLCKYVANMIVVQAAKGLDEKDRKDVIKKIKETQPAEDEEEKMPEDDGMDMPEDGGEEEIPMQEGRMYTKRTLLEMMMTDMDRENELPAKPNKKLPHSGPYSVKNFK